MSESGSGSDGGAGTRGGVETPPVTLGRLQQASDCSSPEAGLAPRSRPRMHASASWETRSREGDGEGRYGDDDTLVRAAASAGAAQCGSHRQASKNAPPAERAPRYARAPARATPACECAHAPLCPSASPAQRPQPARKSPLRLIKVPSPLETDDAPSTSPPHADVRSRGARAHACARALARSASPPRPLTVPPSRTSPASSRAPKRSWTCRCTASRRRRPR